MSLDAVLTAAVLAEVQRQLAELQRPELVHQRSVERVLSMPARDYLSHCRAGDWPSYADRRLRYAHTADVVAWIKAHPAPTARKAANDVDPEARALAKVGARRVAR